MTRRTAERHLAPAHGGPRYRVDGLTQATWDRPCEPYGDVQVRAGVDALPLAVNPNAAVAPAASEPFQDRFLTVTDDPLTV